MYRFLMIKLLLVSFFLLTNFAQAKQNRTALVIGNAGYKSAPLANPKNDATDIAKVLEKLGFNVILSTDVTLREMDEAVRLFGKTLEKDKGVGLFFYAGHGVQSNGRNYLIPINSGLQREADLKYHALDAGKILDEMGFANNGLNIAILDACRDNPLSRSFRGSRKGLARPSDVPSGILIAYSTAPGKQAADGEGRNSPYTKALIQSMQEKGSPLEKVFKNVIKSVKNETGGKQIPWVSSSVDGDFYFSGKQGETLKITSEIDAESVLLVDAKAKFEILYWESILKKPNVNKYRAYLNKYPDGHFKEIAENELTVLGEKGSGNKDSSTKEPDSTVLNSNRLKNNKSGRQVSMGVDKCAGFLKSMYLTSGPNGNAYDCYKGILATDSNNAKALAGLANVEQQYVNLADKYIKQNKSKKVLVNINKLQRINGANKALPRLRENYEKLVLQVPEISNRKSTTRTQQQKYIEYSRIIEKLIRQKKYLKAEGYLYKLTDLNPQGSKIEVYRKEIKQGTRNNQDKALPSVKLTIEQQQVFNEYKGIIEDILESNRLSDKQAYKVNKYIIELKKINPSSPYIKKFTSIYNSKLNY